MQRTSYSECCIRNSIGGGRGRGGGGGEGRGGGREREGREREGRGKGNTGDVFVNLQKGRVLSFEKSLAGYHKLAFPLMQW